MTLTTEQMNARDNLVNRKKIEQELLKQEELRVQKAINELYEQDSHVKFGLLILEKEIKALEEMK